MGVYGFVEPFLKGICADLLSCKVDDLSQMGSVVGSLRILMNFIYLCNHTLVLQS